MIQAAWERNRNDLIKFFNYPEDIRKAIYTTNAIEPLNFSLRKITRNKSSFPDNDLIYKLAGVLSGVYQFVTKKSKNEIKNLMDEMSFFIGNEIYETGFANNFEKIAVTEKEEPVIESRDTLIMNAKLKIKNCYDELKKNAEKKRRRFS